MPETATAFVGMGANTGDRLGTIEAALVVLDDTDGVEVVDVSGVYESAPWGGVDDDGTARHVTDQPPFLNAVARLRTTLSPHDLLAELLATEAAFGRDRAAEQRWGPRVLDLDLLLHGDAVVDDPPTLVLPHPRLAERAFVLVPLSEVFAGGSLPDGTRITRLLMALGSLEGVDLHVRLAEVPGSARLVERPAGPRGGSPLLADEWEASRGDGA